MHPLENLMYLSDVDQLVKLDISLSKSLPFHFYWKDNNGKYLGCNNTQAQFSGFEKGSDIVGCTDFDLCWSAFAASLKKNDKKIMLNDKSDMLIEPVVTVDGKPITALSYKMPLRLRTNNRVIGVMGASFFINKDEIHHLLKCSNIEKYYSNTEAAFLTDREADCLYFLIKGHTLKRIGKQLGLSTKTIEHYLEAVKKKMNCNNRVDLIIKGLELPCIKLRMLNNHLKIE